MRYGTKSSFDRAFKSLSPAQQDAVEAAVLKLCDLCEGSSSALPKGLGLKPMGRGYFEIRVGIHLRVIFRRDDGITLYFAGDHNAVARFVAS